MGGCNIRMMVDAALPSTKASAPLRTLAEAIKEMPAPPCDGCSNAARCAAEPLAYVPFLEYIRSPRGRFDSEALREPTTETYDRAFG